MTPTATDTTDPATAVPSSAFLEQIWEFLLSGGIFMLLIGACSLVAATVFFHRLISLRRSAIEPARVSRLIEQAERYFKRGDFRGFASQVVRGESALGRLAATAVETPRESRAEIEAALSARSREEVLRMQAGLPVLEVVITIAPLLGLLGTVSGLVSVFGVMGEAGSEGASADPALLASGIAKALNTTIAGLVVAVPTVMAHSYFGRRIEEAAVRIERQIAELVEDFLRCGGLDAEPDDGEVSAPIADGPLVGGLAREVLP